MYPLTSEFINMANSPFIENEEAIISSIGKLSLLYMAALMGPAGSILCIHLEQ